MSKHTPGEWKLLKFEDDERYEVTDESGTHGFHRAIATVSFGYSEPAETEQHANAKLIAAAPELLSTLEKIRDHEPMGGDEWITAVELLQRWAREAIAKATE
jgi:hypothetical protein